MVTGERKYNLFDGAYIITKSGTIYSNYHDDEDYPFTIKHQIDKDGYPSVTLTVEGVPKTKTVHRLLGETFIPNPDNKPQLNHKNGNKLDYSLDNLEWCTAKENMRHSMDTGLCKPPKQPCKVIDISTGKIYPSISKAAADLKISYSNCKKYLLGLVANKTTLEYYTPKLN